MAEAYLRQLGGDEFDVESAGFKPTRINPLVVEVMREEGVDLTGKPTQSAFELFKRGKVFTYVITVCDDAVEAQCPIFPGMTHRMHLPFPDPATVTGDHAEQLRQVREIRDRIKAVVTEFVDWVRGGETHRLGKLWDLRDIEKR